MAAGAEGEPLLDEIAHRLALGVAAVCVILDPGLVVLAGEVGHAGGAALTSRVEEAVARICPVRPQVVTTAVTDPQPGAARRRTGRAGPGPRGAAHLLTEQVRRPHRAVLGWELLTWR